MALNTSALSKHKAVLFDYRSVQCELRSVRNSSGQNRSNNKLGIVVSSLLRERLLDEDICKQNGLNQVTIVDQSWILLFVSLKFEVVRETGSVLCGTALWDYNWDAVALFIGCYEVALENWVKLRPPKQKPTHIVPTVQFETTSTQSHVFSTPVLPGLGMISLLYMRRGALGRD